MLSGIVLILGKSPSATAARRYAFALAREGKAPIAGLAIVDPQMIAPAEPTPLGGDAFKVHKDEVALEKARADAADFERLFGEECQGAGVPCETATVEGRTLQAVIDACAMQDLVVVGKDIAHEAAQSPSPSPVLLRLLRDNPRPVIVCSHDEQGSADGATLVAYDASLPAMRSLQLFALLGLRKRAALTVLTVHERQSDAVAISRQGAAYLRKHGYNASAHHVEGDTAADEVLANEARRLKAALIVAGAYGRQGLREWLLGSTTKKLIEASPLPLFVHH